MISNRVVGIAEIVLGTKQELVALFANKDCIIATILFYEEEINQITSKFNHKTSREDLKNMKKLISENIRYFNLSNHYDKFQMKLRELIMSKIPK